MVQKVSSLTRTCPHPLPLDDRLSLLRPQVQLRLDVLPQDWEIFSRISDGMISPQHRSFFAFVSILPSALLTRVWSAACLWCPPAAAARSWGGGSVKRSFFSVWSLQHLLLFLGSDQIRPFSPKVVTTVVGETKKEAKNKNKAKFLKPIRFVSSNFASKVIVPTFFRRTWKRSTFGKTTTSTSTTTFWSEPTYLRLKILHEKQNWLITLITDLKYYLQSCSSPSAADSNQLLPNSLRVQFFKSSIPN